MTLYDSSINFDSLVLVHGLVLGQVESQMLLPNLDEGTVPQRLGFVLFRDFRLVDNYRLFVADAAYLKLLSRLVIFDHGVLLRNLC